MSNYYDPPKLVVCPCCNGTKEIKIPSYLCDDCPFDDGKSCASCIEAGDHILKETSDCPECDATGEVWEDEMALYIHEHK